MREEVFSYRDGSAYKIVISDQKNFLPTQQKNELADILTNIHTYKSVLLNQTMSKIVILVHAKIS